MDFGWDEEQEALRDAAADFARHELNDDVAGRDHRAEFSARAWKKCADFGVLGLPFRRAYGGAEADILTTILTMEGLGYGCRDNGLLFSLNAQMWSVQHPIAEFGSDGQRERYLPGLIAGDVIGAHGMSEPGSGSDAYSLATRAERVDGGYLLNGTKTFVTSAPHADLALVFATLDPAVGQWGVSAFIIENGTPGFSVGHDIDKMGLRTAPMGELVMSDCFVPEDNRLGPEGAGAAIFGNSMEWERASILATNVGAMHRQLETCVLYAQERRQFGKPIGTFQSVSNRIADMAVRLETSRLVLYKVAWLKAKGEPAAYEAAIAKLHLSESFVRSSEDAIRVHGGYGYATETEIERDLRDAIGGTIYSGTSDIQRSIIANWLEVS
jgi:alkylation response protein AidB-like acyl-CoA dehydrogenase